MQCGSHPTKTLFKSYRIVNEKNNLLQAPKLFACEERQMHQNGDLSAAAAASRRGKGPQTGCLVLQVSGSLQEAAVRPGCYCLPNMAQGGTQTEELRKQDSRRAEGKGAWSPALDREPGIEVQQVVHTQKNQRSSAYKMLVYLKSLKPLVFKAILSHERLTTARDEFEHGPF